MDERFDVLVIGAGVAGLRAAIALAQAGARVAVATKDEPQTSSSGQARGGIAVALSGEEQDIVLHAADTLAAGDHLCDAPAVSCLVRDGRGEVLSLIDWGARFDREGDRYHLTREAAHSMPRILHAGGDATGREIVRTLVARLRRGGGVERLSGHMATDLLVGDGRCVGARLLTASGEVLSVHAGSVLLATGGIGCCWKVSSNPPEATGDGVALGIKAGCLAGDMEFVQFHPTALALEGAPPVLLTEALRGEGGVIVSEAGKRFLHENDERGELAPRDIVARGIARKIRNQDGRPVGLDLGALKGDHLEHRFPGVVELCQRYGLDPRHEVIPVRPAAHYAMGGLVTDLDGRTTLPGLFAAGEVACTGVHGANRLASNSLLEGLVFGARAARRMIADSSSIPVVDHSEEPLWEVADPAQADVLRDLAERTLGIVRNGESLDEAVEILDGVIAGFGRDLPSPGARRAAVETTNIARVLRSVAEAARWRRESRGAHFREDHPASDDIFHLHSRIHPDGAVTGSAVR